MLFRLIIKMWDIWNNFKWLLDGEAPRTPNWIFNLKKKVKKCS